jgi:DNA-binding SARP family transcriptional activator
MNALRIRLLGGLGLSDGDTPLDAIPGQKARDLLAYLALNRDRPLHRDVLCGALWGEQSDAEARKALRSALWRLRSVLEPDDARRGAYFRVAGDQLRFPGTADPWVDVAEFDACTAEITPDRTGELPPGQAERLVRAVALYRGDLLDGIYSDWCFPDRERLRMARLTALERLLAHYQARGQWLAALSTGRALLRLDPLREHVHRRLMICHLSMGDRPSALRQFDGYARQVREELGVDPLEETRKLRDWIRDHGTLPEANGAYPGPTQELAGEIDQALQSLHALIDRLEAARASVRQRPVEAGPDA